MKNQDMPAMPIVSEFGEKVGSAPGLSKLEHFAGRAMQGHLSNPNAILDPLVDEDRARFYVQEAKRLLAELEKV